MCPHESDSTHTARARLLHAAKTLFARLGYEQTSTSAIAREAGSSESQLVRYFGGKAGLLEAIFNVSWDAVNRRVAAEVPESTPAREAVLRIFAIVIDAFGRDHDIAVLFLFEGRRIRGSEVALSRGFLQFYDLIRSLITRGQKDGSFRTDLDPITLNSALVGAAEGMVRDRLLAERRGLASPFSEAAISRTFEAIVSGLQP